jgi:hypothetical protein
MEIDHSCKMVLFGKEIRVQIFISDLSRRAAKLSMRWHDVDRRALTVQVTGIEFLVN